MRGRGTASDPYIITSPAELYAMESVGSPGTYFALGCDIDLGGTPAEETFLPVVLNCRRLDGRGFRIRNILSVLHEGAVCIFLIPPAAESPALKDLVIENARGFSEAGRQLSHWRGAAYRPPSPARGRLRRTSASSALLWMQCAAPSC